MDTPEAIANTYLQRHVSIDIGSALSRGWALLQANMGVLIGATLLGWVVSVGLSIVPVLGWVVGFVLMGGLDYMFLRRIRGQDIEVGDVFAGFNLAFMNLSLAGLVKTVLIFVGCLLC